MGPIRLLKAGGLAAGWLAAASTLVAAGESVSIGRAIQACSPSYLPLWIAQEEGFFEDAGLAPRLGPLRAGPSGLESLAKGSDVIVLGRAELYRRQAEKPGELTAFSAAYLDASHPNYAIVVRAESRASGLADLPGRRIGLHPQSGAARTVLMTLVLERSGLAPADFALSTAGPDDLLSGRVDALYAREPALSALLADGKAKILVDEPVGRLIREPWPMSFWAFSRRFRSERPEAARKVLEVWDRAVGFARAHPDRASRALDGCVARKTGREARVRPLALWKQDEIDRAVVQWQMDLYFEHGLIPSRIRVDDVVPPPARSSRLVEPPQPF